ncbi:MAG: phenylacetate-CoA ligase [Lentimonas sp.]|jgi:phenylacetate-CoA ligase
MKRRQTTWWEKASADEIHHRQSIILTHFLKSRVLPFARHYKDVFKAEGLEASDIKSTDDLIKIPFTNKADFGETRDFAIIPDEALLKKQWSTIKLALRHGPKGAQLLLARELRPIFMTSTTGRSSAPVPFLYTQHDLDRLEVSGRRLMEICESKPDYRHINAFPFAPHLAFWQAHYAGLGFNTFTLSTGGGKTLGTDGNVRVVSKINPDAIIAMPTFLYHMLQQATEEKAQWSKLKSIVLGGEKVPEGMRKKLRELCAQIGTGPVRIMSTYGFTEAKVAWSECPAPVGESSTGFHIYPDMGFVEIIDPETRKRVPNGQPGEIVFTHLNARGSIVLRYRTGDLIEHGITDEPCPHCGRTCPRLLGKISRVSDIHHLHLDKLKGTLVDFNQLEHLIDDTPGIGAWQLEIRKHNDDPLDLDELIVHAVGLNGAENLEQIIQQRFHEKMEISPNAIEIHSWTKMRQLQGVGTELKEQKVIDHRPTSKKS